MQSDAQVWWDNATIYELYVDKFAGTFKSCADKMWYLDRLGVSAVHVLPHYPSPMIDGGYDIQDYKNVRLELGSLADFEVFVQAAHQSNIRVMTDLVLNHVSVTHPWFQDALNTPASAYKDFFLWSKTGDTLQSGWNAFPELKENNWIWSEAAGAYYYATFYPEQADLNWDNPAVFEAIMDVIDFWVARGVDGFRLDAALALIKRDAGSQGLPETHAILKKIRAHADARHGGAVAFLAEAHQSIPDLKKFFADGNQCHLTYHFPMTEALFQTVAFENSSYFKNVIAQSLALPESCAWVHFLRNHDELSLATLSADERSRLIDALDPQKKFLFNKGTATAIRIGSAFTETKLKYAYDLLYSLPGATMLYYGDELGTQSETVQHRDMRVSARGAFDWEKAAISITNPYSLASHIANLQHKKRSMIPADPVYKKAPPTIRSVAH